MCTVIRRKGTAEVRRLWSKSSSRNCVFCVIPSFLVLLFRENWEVFCAWNVSGYNSPSSLYKEETCAISFEAKKLHFGFSFFPILVCVYLYACILCVCVCERKHACYSTCQVHMWKAEDSCRGWVSPSTLFATALTRLAHPCTHQTSSPTHSPG